MNEEQIERLKLMYPRKVFETDKELWSSYNRNEWEELGEGGEHRIFKVRLSEEIAKEALPDLLGNSLIGNIRFNRFQLEFTLPKSPFITNTISVSPTFSVELRRGLDLEDYIIKNTKITLKDRLLWIKDLYTGLFLIHSKRVAHLDLKPENIFINGKHLSIGDFGNIHAIDSGNNTTHGTHVWGLPEISERRGIAIDMYSASLITIGILTWNSSIMFTCRSFAESLFSKQRINEMCNTLGTLLQDSCTNELKNLNIGNSIIEELKCSIVGTECDPSCDPDSFKTMKILDLIINEQ